MVIVTNRAPYLREQYRGTNGAGPKTRLNAAVRTKSHFCQELDCAVVAHNLVIIPSAPSV
jgi:hypothetical protein